MTLRLCCVHVPDLAVQAVLRERFGAADIDIPLALVTDAPERKSVVAASFEAQQLGVHPGVSLAAARGACPELVVVEHDPAHTDDALQGLADALGVFGPLVSLVPPESVLVDATGVRCVDVTGDALLQAAADLGLLAQVAIASTPFAAMALASHAALEEPVEPAHSEERRAVERLPLAAAHLPPRAYEALNVVGIRTVGAFMALPAASLSRRFGSDVRALWRQAHGREMARLVPHDPERPIVERSRHHDDPIERIDPLCFALKTLLDRALRRLHGRGLGVEELVVRLELEPVEPPPDPSDLVASLRPPSPLHVLTLDLGRATTDITLLLQLLRERLSSGNRPPGKVITAHLTVTRATSLAPLQLDLFGDPAPPETIQTTVARLAAILGSETRFTPSLREDYRPERAWELTPFAAARARRIPEQPAPPPAGRPTRLLRAPSPLRDVRGRGPPPGAISGPERLVSGWWDGAPVARDYWVVSDRWGRRSWVYRDITSSVWFLHGHFD